MTFSQLEYLIALDKTKSFKLAAEQCFITQPALSMQIQKLEQDWGVKLIDRSSYPIQTTAIGQKIIKQALQILHQVELLNATILENRGLISKKIKLAVIPTSASFLIPELLKINHSKDYELELFELTTDQIILELKAGSIDYGIMATPTHDAELNELVLYYEELYAYGSFSDKQSKNVSIEDLRENKVWLLKEGHCFRNQVLNLCEWIDKRESGHSYESGSLETLKRIVDKEQGVTLLPKFFCNDFSKQDLKKLKSVIPQPVRELSLVSSINQFKRKAQDKFLIDLLAMTFVKKNVKSVKAPLSIL